GVYEVEAGIEGAMDNAHRLAVVALAPGAEHHRAEAQRAHLDASAAERTQLHRPTLTTRHPAGGYTTGARLTSQASRRGVDEGERSPPSRRRRVARARSSSACARTRSRLRAIGRCR